MRNRYFTRADEEQGFELKLRHRWLREFIGQSKAKEPLAIFEDQPAI
jgi:Holliday junction DNA helicase RuvB